MISENKGVYKILVIDDDKITRMLVSSIFKDKRYSVTLASSGEMALDILPNVTPDLIFLDINMAGINGLEVLRQVRAHKELKYTKIILLSAETDVKERLRGYELGADDYMVKPFVGGELIAKVEVFMRMTYIEEKNVSLEELVNKEIEKHRQQEEYLFTRAKLLAMGDMVLAIAHYWRQPLSALAIAVQDVHDAFLHNELTEEYLNKSVNSSMLHISFMSEIIENFQKMIADDKSDSLFNVNLALKNVVLLTRDKLKDENVELFMNGVHPDEYFKDTLVSCIIKGRDWILKQALSSIIQCSLDAVHRKRISSGNPCLAGNIKLKIWTTGDTVNISAGNDGEPLKDEDLARIFEPYYLAGQTMDSGNKGLDLYFSRTVIEKQLGGKIYASNKDGKTIFVIELTCVSEIV